MAQLVNRNEFCFLTCTNDMDRYFWSGKYVPWVSSSSRNSRDYPCNAMADVTGFPDGRNLFRNYQGLSLNTNEIRNSRFPVMTTPQETEIFFYSVCHLASFHTGMINCHVVWTRWLHCCAMRCTTCYVPTFSSVLRCKLEEINDLLDQDDLVRIIAPLVRVSFW